MSIHSFGPKRKHVCQCLCQSSTRWAKFKVGHKPQRLNKKNLKKTRKLGWILSVGLHWVHRSSVTFGRFSCLSDSGFLPRRNQFTLHRKQSELWRHRGLQVRVPHVLRHDLLLLPLRRHHDPRAQQQGPASRHPKWVRHVSLPPGRPLCACWECASPCWPNMWTACCVCLKPNSFASCMAWPGLRTCRHWNHELTLLFHTALDV